MPTPEDRKKEKRKNIATGAAVTAAGIASLHPTGRAVIGAAATVGGPAAKAAVVKGTAAGKAAATLSKNQASRKLRMTKNSVVSGTQGSTTHPFLSDIKQTKIGKLRDKGFDV